MKLLLLCEIFSIAVLFSGCKNPPNVTPCLINANTLKAQAEACMKNGLLMNDPKCTIDVRTVFAGCSPVDKKKKAYDLQLWQMDKFYSLSNTDFGTLLQWINAHDDQ